MFRDIWRCSQCDTINREGRSYCGLCGLSYKNSKLNIQANGVEKHE